MGVEHTCAPPEIRIEGDDACGAPPCITTPDAEVSLARIFVIECFREHLVGGVGGLASDNAVADATESIEAVAFVLLDGVGAIRRLDDGKSHRFPLILIPAYSFNGFTHQGYAARSAKRFLLCLER